MTTQDDPTTQTESFGGASAFEQLVLTYQDRIYTLACRMVGDRETARDLAQEAFAKAFQGLSDFRKDSSFYTWLHRITINLCLTERRRRHVRRKLKLFSNQRTSSGAEFLESDIPSSGPAPGDSMNENERNQAVQREVFRLDRDVRDVIVLRDMEGLSYEEIAESLMIPIGTVRSRIHRGRDQLRRRLHVWMGSR